MRDFTMYTFLMPFDHYLSHSENIPIDPTLFSIVRNIHADTGEE